MRPRESVYGRVETHSTARLGHAHEEVDFSVRSREVAVLEEQELDLPDSGGGDGERVGHSPTLVVSDCGVIPGPCSAVNLNCLVEPCGCVIDESYPNEVDSYGEVRVGLFTTRYAQYHGNRFRSVDSGW